jgi:putative phage-type endonuclease
MEYTEIEQGTPEWFAARCGKITASKISDVMMKPTTAGYRNYRAQLMCERLTGNVAESFTSAAMQWGTDTEPQARAAYEFYSGSEVVEAGFVDHPSIKNTGASPDGLVGDDGCVEIKCPNTATHLETLLGGKIPSKYYDQMQWQMECTGRVWCDFVSFDPRLPEAMQMYVQRVSSDEARMIEITMGVTSLLDQIDTDIAALRAKYEPQAEAA